MKGSSMITLNFPHAQNGHKEEVYDATTPVARKSLCEKVKAFLGSGKKLILTTSEGGKKVTRLIQEYDPKTNEWVLADPNIEEPNRTVTVTARSTSPTHLRPITGG